MRIPILILLLILSFVSGAQSKWPELRRLISHAKYEEAIEQSRACLARDKNDVSPLVIIGMAKYRLHEYDSCIYYLKLATPGLEPASTQFYTAHIQSAYCHHVSGNKQAALSELEACAVRKAGKKGRDIRDYSMALLGYSEFYKSWQTIETEHIRFCFQDTNGIKNMREFLEGHERAYEMVNRRFKASLPQKVDFYVWESPEDGKEKLGKRIGFARPDMYLTHSHKAQSAGHELTHIVSFWGMGGREHYNKLINEGIAEVFSLDGNDHLARAKESTKNMYVGDVLNVWLNADYYSDNVIYPLGGALVLHLMKNGTEEQLISIIRDQSLENARKTYGADFDRLISEFNSMMEFK